MKLNIETSNPKRTLAILQDCFVGEKVVLTQEYSQTADYEITPINITQELRVYPATSLLELNGCISLSQIRIY